MARALLTADELRRMDVDECIIYEKGIKPIKAQKYYYYKYSTEKTIKPYQVDHNTREDVDRGKWRKYNPYNPYVEEDEKKEVTKIEQLDDLFSDEEPKEESPKTEAPKEIKSEAPKQEENKNIAPLDMPMQLPLEPIETPKEEPKRKQQIFKKNQKQNLMNYLEA